FIKKRRANWHYLYEGLKDLENYFILPQATLNSEPSWFGFLITLKDNQSFSRNEIVEYLEKNNIQTRNLFAGNLVKQPVFSSLKKGKDYRIIDNLDNTDRIMHNSFWVGIHPGLGRKQLKCIIKHINEFSSSR
ncbi:DegT/DnrJ/EryC1/StrS family aminotransferase, partial [Patescibacteria group bacterium]|nr:DegT/DnrJ/EryC1/StrS family aminotransferase [Patescibacteria group bacterium]